MNGLLPIAESLQGTHPGHMVNKGNLQINQANDTGCRPILFETFNPHLNHVIENGDRNLCYNHCGRGMRLGGMCLFPKYPAKSICNLLGSSFPYILALLL